MAEQIVNYAATSLNAAIDNDDTSVSVTDGSVFPSTGNFRCVIQDSEDNQTNREIVLVTARSSNTLTVTRGQESTSGVAHSDGAYIAAILTAGALNAAYGRVPNLLDSVKVTADTPDDEFPTSTLDGQWTAVDGSSGTVSLLAGSGAGVYDLATRPGWLMAQVGTAIGDGVTLRQDYTLPDGNCIVAAISFAGDLVASPANNEIWAGIGVNDNDTGIEAGTAAQTALAQFDTEAGGARVIGWDGTSTLGSNTLLDDLALFGMLAFLRIDRSGLNYQLFWSPDGFTWNYIATKTMGTAANNLWLFFEVRATMTNRIVLGCPWFRQGTALAIDPWPLA